MKEKKILSAEEIEAQILLELPNRRLMSINGVGAINTSTINAAIQAILVALGF